MPRRLLPDRTAPGNIYRRHDRMAAAIDAACGGAVGDSARVRTPRCEMKFCWVRCTTQFLTGYSSVVQLLLLLTAVTKLSANFKRRVIATNVHMVTIAPMIDKCMQVVLYMLQKQQRYNFITHAQSAWVEYSAPSVCWFVCLFIRIITQKRMIQKCSKLV